MTEELTYKPLECVQPCSQVSFKTLTNNSPGVFVRHPSAVPVEIKVTILSKTNSEVEICLDKLHLDTGISGGVVGWNFQHGQFAPVEGQLLDGFGIQLNPLSNPDQLIDGSELECGGLLAIVKDGDSNGSQPSVLPVGVVWNKESIHLEVVIADEVEGRVVDTLESVAE